MIFDGMRWSICRSVAPLPASMWSQSYVGFGKIVPSGAKGAVKTEYKWFNSIPKKYWGSELEPLPDGNEKGKDYWEVYAVPIKAKGYSLTNMMIAEDGSLYLLFKGTVYMRGRKSRL